MGKSDSENIAMLGMDDDEFDEEDSEEEEGEAMDDESEDGSDGSEEESDGDEEGSDGGGKGGSRKFQPPTQDELSILREGADSAELALFQLQAEELLKETRVDYAGEAPLDAALHELKGILEGLPAEEVEGEVEVGGAFFEALGIPAPKVSFRAPASVSVVGSYILRTVARPDTNVDVAVEMRKEMFHEKDFLNHRYHAKRAVFLAVVARRLRRHKAFSDLQFESALGDPCRPVLSIRPKLPGGKGAGFRIRVHPAIAPGMFPAGKLAPDRNCVRDAGAAPGTVPAPTPLYNQSILADMAAAGHARTLHAAVTECKGLSDAIILVKVWARQRGLSSEPGGLGGFALSMLAAHLLEKGKVAAYMSPTQILRVLLKDLADGKKGALEKGCSLNREDADAPAPALSVFPKAFGASLVDAGGRVNVTARVSKPALAEARAAAARTLELLADADAAEAFDAALLAPPLPLAASWDWLVHVELPLPGGAAGEGEGEEGQGLRRGKDDCRWRREEAAIRAALEKGLGTRAKLVRVAPRRAAPYSLPGGAPELEGAGTIRVGVVGNGAEALRLVDVGPSPEDKAAAKAFRAFWGDKAELRRFRDGTIAESVVWQVPGHRRHEIVPMLCAHVIERAIPGATAWGTAGQLDTVLPESPGDAGGGQALTQALTLLSKRIRNLESLPLKVVNLQPLGPSLYQAAVSAPSPHPLARVGGGGHARLLEQDGPVPKCLDPVDVLVHLEGSGRWPDDWDAVQKMKASLALQVARALEEAYQVPSIAAEAQVDVLFEGYAFRLHVHTPQDEAVERKVLANKRKLPPGLGATAMLGWARHAGAMQGLVGEHPAAAATMRLAKRWVGAQLLSGHLSDRAVESLVAHVFLHPGAGAPPAARLPAFLRFLHLLATHPWAARPLVVGDGDGTGEAAPRAATEARFQRLREQGSRDHAMYLASAGDPGSEDTASRPGPDVLGRAVACARRSLKVVARLAADGGAGGSGAEPAAGEWLAAFRSPPGVFDVLLRLRRPALPHPGRSFFAGGGKPGAVAPADPLAPHPRIADALVEAPPPRKRAKAALGKLAGATVARGESHARRQLLVGMDPVGRYVRDVLEARYGHLAVFCYDACGGDCVAVAWRPEAFLPAPLRTATAATSLQLGPATPAGKKGAGAGEAVGVPNVVQVVGEWVRAGEGLVGGVEFVESSSLLGGKM